MDNFARNLKALRLEKGLGQATLAKEIGVSCGIISLWENEKREPTKHYLVLLAKFFDVSLDELVDFE